MVQLLAYYRGKSWDTFLNTIPVHEYEDDSEYTWEVIGSNRRNIPLVEARLEDGTPVTAATGMVGANTTPFYLVFNEDWFADGEYIVGILMRFISLESSAILAWRELRRYIELNSEVAT